MHTSRFLRNAVARTRPAPASVKGTTKHTSLNRSTQRKVQSILAISALFALSAASAAGAHVPAGAVLPQAGPALSSAVIQHHALGALAPTHQVDPAPSRAASLALPASVDLSTSSVPVGNQGPTVGSCTTWAIDYAMLGWYSNHDHRPGQPFNPMYTYSQIHGDNSAGGGGSYAYEALRIAYEQGNDTKADYWQNTEDFTDLPTAAERANAANYKIAGWQRLYENVSLGGSSADAGTIRTALGQGKPVAIGIVDRTGFDNLKSTSYVDDDVTGYSRGLHEVMATGYDSGGVWIQNSWGTAWGYGGYGYLTWRVVEHDVYQAHTISGFAANDTTAPVMGAVNDRLNSGQITSTTAPVQVSWSATDNTGVTGYEVYWSADNGQTWNKDAKSAETATAIVRSFPFGTTYRYAVRARDAAGNWSGYAYSSPMTATVFDDTSYTVNSPWARYTLSGTFGGTYIASSAAGASITRSFTGTDVAWIAPKFSSAGQASVSCDGGTAVKFDLYSASTLTRKIIARCHWTGSASHTMKVVGEGTAGRPWTAVDAFVALS